MANYSYKWPGVYPNILDNSQIIVDNTITSLGLVGEAETGLFLCLMSCLTYVMYSVFDSCWQRYEEKPE